MIMATLSQHWSMFSALHFTNSNKLDYYGKGGAASLDYVFGLV